MMELQNSLGCKMCHKPLERCEPVNKTNTRRPGRHGGADKNHQSPVIKFEGTFRQQLMQGAKAEELDPVPVAARCGHMFHKGCIKKMTTELNSSCIECPICTKPVTLTNVWQIEFYHPEKDSSKRARTLSSKVHCMNEKNNTLQEELVEVRRLRSHKEVEYLETVEAVNNIKQNILQRRKELDEKLVQIFGAPSLDEKYEENVRMEKEAILQRVKELTNRNSELLASIEERAKTHYVNEYENTNDDSVIKELENRENHKQNNKYEEKGIIIESIEIGDTLKSSSLNQRTSTLKSSTHELNTTSSNLKQSAKGDAQSTIITIGKIDDKTDKKSSRRKSHQLSTQEALFDALKGPQDASSTLTSCMNITNIHNNNNSNNNNISNSSFQNINGNSSKRAAYPIPMATVTKSMQELFEQEKLKYLLGQSREESRLKKDKEEEERQKESISQDYQHQQCITSNTVKKSENESIEHGSESSASMSSDVEEEEKDSTASRSPSLFPENLKPKPNPGTGIGTGTNIELILSQQSRKVIASESQKKKDKEFPIFQFKYHEPRSSRSSKETGENIIEKMSKTYFENATAATTKSPNYQNHHQCHRQPTPLSKPLAVKNLKFKPSKVSVKGKSGRLKSQPPSQYKLAFPSAEPQTSSVKTHDFTKYVLNMTQQKRQRWKRLPGEESNIAELNLTGKPFYGHNNI